MVSQLNKEILEKVDDIIQTIEESTEYKKYLDLKEKISNNKELMELINKVRVMQKDVLHKKNSQTDLDKLLDELNNNPLYREYNNVIYELNNTYSIVENSINNYFEKIVN